MYDASLYDYDGPKLVILTALILAIFTYFIFLILLLYTLI
jgi:hypothetical protein